jgi:hypothetical protein
MKRFLGFVFRHGTAIAWITVALAWVPLVLVKALGDDTWNVFGWLLLLAVLAVAWSAVGALLGAVTALRLDRKRWALLACAANLASLWLLLGVLSS